MPQRAVLVNLPKNQSLNVEFRDIHYSVPQGWRSRTRKQILKGVSGSFRTGELTALMGPSGAGKSSLFNILTGFQRQHVEGSIVFGATDHQQDWSEYQQQSCYIQQDDRLMGVLKVQETMELAADLKMGDSLSRKGKLMVIEDMLENLDLLRVRYNFCDKLSGGQRKRLSIALELLDNPPIMFLDEPTTGLDSASCQQLVTLLKRLARSGRTIVCTIHQPSAPVYEMFDHVYLIAEGRCVYQGDPRNTVDYFARAGLVCPRYHNPADFMIEVIGGEYGNFLDVFVQSAQDPCWRSAASDKPLPYHHAILNSSANNNSVTVVNNNNNNNNNSVHANSHKHHENGKGLLKDQDKTTVLVRQPPETARFAILVRRTYIQLFRDWTISYFRCFVHFLIGVLLGLLFEGAGQDAEKVINNVGFLMVSTTYLSYTTIMPAALKFPQELPIIKKESFNNWYKLSTYYLAYLVVNVPLQMAFAFVYSIPAYFFSSQPLELDRFAMFYLTSVLAMLVAESFGLIIGALVNPINGTFISAIWICATLLFAGFLVLLDHMPRFMYYVTYISYQRYAFEAYVLTVYGLGRKNLDCSSSDEDIHYCHYKSPKMILELLALDQGNIWIDFAMMFIIFVLFRMTAYYSLKRTVFSAK